MAVAQTRRDGGGLAASANILSGEYLVDAKRKGSMSDSANNNDKKAKIYSYFNLFIH